MATNEARNIKRLTYPVYQKIVDSKTSIQKEKKKTKNSLLKAS